MHPTKPIEPHELARTVTRVFQDESERLRIGDRVQVSESLASEYAGAHGVIIAIEDRQSGPIRVAECEVEFKDGIRRRFLGFQLTRL